jgi:Ca2+-binding RTX toxin-like protein
LDGGASNDYLAGGAGDDTYVVDVLTDTVQESSAAWGVDTVLSGVTFTLGNHLENLTITAAGSINGTGNTLSNVVIGGGGANSLSGDSGNDTLSGAGGNDTLNGGAGNDSMAGGSGNDRFVVDSVDDVVSEMLGEGTDVIDASVHVWMLAENVENLTLTGSSDLIGVGNELNNRIIGNAGGNFLQGGVGADTMEGGAGSDSYLIADVGDVIIETASGEWDQVISMVSYTLSANLESIVLDGSDNINATGNSGDNYLGGNGGANLLVGNGGHDELNGHAGADTMQGGTGNDVYTVDDTGDLVSENSSAGTDQVSVYITVYTLEANVETLAFAVNSNVVGIGNSIGNTIWGGNGDDSLSGLGGNDYIDGDDGDDTLAGGANGDSLFGGDGNDLLDGGANGDSMSGGAGDDTYIVDGSSDTVWEASAANGIDTVLSAVSLTLGSNVENLTLTATGSVNGTGNSLDNAITGGSGANVLNGSSGNDTLSGGAGNDNLTGGSGSDEFVFSSWFTSNVDTITDFSSGTDIVALDDDIFWSLAGLGSPAFALPGANFVANAGGVSGDGDDFILYDTSTGRLYYDSDGNGALSRVHFATLTGAPSLSASDIEVIA